MYSFIQISYHFGHKGLFLTALLTMASCGAPITYTLYSPEKSKTGHSHMVVSAHPLASDAGNEIMEKGGNAIDAAIATQFALAVTYPRASALGGGGFMIFRDSIGQMHTLDFREKAPHLATRDMYLNENGEPEPGLSLYGPLASGVPGTVKAMVEAHERFGSIEWSELVEPAISIARQGFAITEAMAVALNNIQDDIDKYSNGRSPYRKKTPWKKGDILRQRDLQVTLERIAKNGASEWRDGKTVQLISTYMKKHGGIIRQKDFISYQPVWRTPVSCTFNEYTIYSMGPPSSGGVTLCQMLGMIEPFTPFENAPGDADMVHLLTEVQRRAYADRVSYIGDSDFIQVPIDSLLRKDYLHSRMHDFDPDHATSSKEITGGLVRNEGSETTHLSVADDFGQAVSMTLTLNSWFGSKVMVPGTGFFLNNEMDDFTIKPGVANQFGLVGSKANSIAPEKRMVSSMSPVIVEKNDRLFMILGTPGGTTIPNSILQVFLYATEYNLLLPDAVNRKRFHHQWLPDKIFIEKDALTEEVRNQLQAMGHTIEVRRAIGRVEAILVNPTGELHGAADNRMDDDVEGR